MITGSIATFFLQGREERTNPHVEHLRELLDRWEELTPDERRHAAVLMNALAEDADEVATAAGD